MSPKWMESTKSSRFEKLVQLPNYKYEGFFFFYLNHRIYFSAETCNKINEIIKNQKLFHFHLVKFLDR